MKSLYKTYHLLAFCLVALSWNVSAQVYVNASASGANNGSSWTDAFTDVQAALDIVPANGEVWVAAGTYKPGASTPAVTNSYTFPHDLKLYGGFEGTETMLSERDIDANLTLLSGDLAGDDVPGTFSSNREDNVMHIIFLTDTSTAATVISGFTFSGGNTLGSSGAGDDRRGGAILSYGALSIDNCKFIDNYGWFGTVYPRGAETDGTTITDCEFRDNEGGNGAGLYFVSTVDGVVSNCIFSGNEVEQRGGAMYLNNCSIDVTGCTFNDNSAPTSTGGAIHFRSGDSNEILVDDCSFSGNSARWGGAINTYDGTSTMLIENSSFQDNTTESRGGAIYMGFQATTEIDNCDFMLNTTEGGGAAIGAQNDTTILNVTNTNFMNNGAANGMDISGGGIGCFGGVFTTIENCFFEGNNANFGAAVHVVEDSVDVASLNLSNSIFQINLANTQAAGLNIAGVESKVENCLFTNNITTIAAGGAIAVNTGGVSPTNVTLLNSTLVSNSAPIGAGLATWTDDSLALTVNIQNVIFSNEAGSNYEVEAGTPTLTSLGGNLSTDATFDGLFLANDIAEMDPLFIDAVNFDYHLEITSPCIDAGVDAGAPTLDLDGNPRVGPVDIGCYEGSGAVASTSSVEDFGVLSVFPNPVNENLNFEFESELQGAVMINVTNIRGQIIKTVELSKADLLMKSNVEVEALSTGIYFLNISMDDKNITTKFMKM